MRSSSLLLACVLQSAVGFQAGVHMAAQRPAIRATTSTMVMPEPATIEAASQLLAAKSQADELLGDAMALVFPAGTALAVAFVVKTLVSGPSVGEKELPVFAGVTVFFTLLCVALFVPF